MAGAPAKTAEARIEAMRTQTVMMMAVLISIGGAGAVPQATAQTNDKASERKANRSASTLYEVLNEQASSRSNQSTGDVGTPVLKRDSNGSACTTDQLVHASVGSNITSRIKNSIVPLQKGIQVRDIAMLTLPCGFKIDDRSGWSLFLTNGSEVRRYIENNPFGFAPAFGFSDPIEKSYTMKYEDIPREKIQTDSCINTIASISSSLKLCSSFGNEESFFGIERSDHTSHLGHYLVLDGAIIEDFPLANINKDVDSVYFIPPPDASGGTITLIVTDGRNRYRAYVDTPRG